MHQLIEDNLTCLEQGIQFLGCLPAELYTTPSTVCFGSAIGGHFRHNIDHYQQLLDGIAKGRVNYDARSRDIEVETQISVAIGALWSLKGGLSALTIEADDGTALEVIMDGGVEAQSTRSSLSRELQFLISHTIHHYALIVTISQTQDFAEFPADFGVAPSTLKFRSQSA
jgi:hypothetical protein|tara:strand:- start:1554 stop:2063 length:510 start_codon:yes stop_codon:yes gene_type:complete